MIFPQGTVILFPKGSHAGLDFALELQREPANQANCFDGSGLEVRLPGHVLGTVTLAAGDFLTTQASERAAELAKLLHPHAAINRGEHRVTFTWPLVATIIGKFAKHREIKLEEPN